jgi:acetyl esterase/lipase
VAVAAETRTSHRHGTGAVEAIEDARDLIRWLRHNADTFNIDPDRVVIGGAAGGALLALLTALPTAKQLPPVDGLDCHPQALILFSALLNASSNSQAKSRFPDSKTVKHTSPAHLVRRKLPPMIFFHGKSDRITPYDEVERFRRRMRWRRNVCEVVDFERADHSFFNFNVSHKNFELSIRLADHFLVQQGLLEADDPDTEL